MNNEAVFVFAVIAIAAVFMASKRVRFDIVALFVAPLVFPFHPS
jgi:hypothetical protein